ncbi:MAG: nuclear transport factor 2 family protein [Acidimicrobiia bacterium]|nr:nuclear transport factor 2 family protein [Acidimicrobiia bacterium]
MTDHPNLEAARAGYEAFAGGDLAAVSELMADDVVWHVGGSNMVSGDYQGKEAVLGLFDDCPGDTGEFSQRDS